jgi:hypothetical protein
LGERSAGAAVVPIRIANGAYFQAFDVRAAAPRGGHDRRA